MTGKRRLFVRYYTNEARWNAAKAAQMAGYAEAKQEGWRLRRDPEIRAAINEILEQEAMGAPEVLSRLREHAAADLGPYMNADGQVDLAAMKADGMTHLIKEYSFEEVYLGGRGGLDDDGERRPPDLVQKRKVKLVDSQAALIQIGRHHSLFTDRLEASGPGGGPLRLEWNDGPTDTDEASESGV